MACPGGLLVCVCVLCCCQDTERLLRMNATIFTERESHVPIILGHKGAGRGRAEEQLALDARGEKEEAERESSWASVSQSVGVQEQ